MIECTVENGGSSIFIATKSIRPSDIADFPSDLIDGAFESLLYSRSDPSTLCNISKWSRKRIPGTFKRMPYHYQDNTLELSESDDDTVKSITPPSLSPSQSIVFSDVSQKHNDKDIIMNAVESAVTERIGDKRPAPKSSAKSKAKSKAKVI